MFTNSETSVFSSSSKETILIRWQIFSIFEVGIGLKQWKVYGNKLDTFVLVFGVGRGFHCFCVEHFYVFYVEKDFELNLQRRSSAVEIHGQEIRVWCSGPASGGFSLRGSFHSNRIIHCWYPSVPISTSVGRWARGDSVSGLLCRSACGVGYVAAD